MGCGGSKDGDTMSSEDKVKTFRDRRLSIQQTQSQDPQLSNRRLSVYGSKGDGECTGMVAPCEACGCISMPGLEPVPGGAASKINQDRGLAIYPFLDVPNLGLFGVYDGHGRAGEKVSEFVIQNLPGMIAEKGASDLLENPGRTLTDAYVKVDDEVGRACDSSVSGTTAVTCLIKDNHLWLANSGDSRAIILRRTKNGTAGLRAIDLTIDQKPDTPAEMMRILKMGGHVTPAGANGSPSRVWHNLRGLAMARSIGDHHAATVGVICEPEISEYDVTPDDFVSRAARAEPWRASRV